MDTPQLNKKQLKENQQQQHLRGRMAGDHTDVKDTPYQNHMDGRETKPTRNKSLAETEPR